MLNNIQKKEILKYATHLYACSKLAGEWLYGNNNFEIINNAIDYDKFKFDIEKRNEIRKELKIKDDVFVVGHVGRFDYQKNHRFIVELAKNFDEQVLFLLIGDGHLKEEIINYEKELGVNNILMIGNKDNVFDYYNAMDCFILPSLFEGLSVVSIESQANGLNCLFSNTVTQECKISKKTNFYSIEDNKNWIEEINSLKENKKNDRNIILNEKYNAKVQSIELQNKYKGYCNKEYRMRVRYFTNIPSPYRINFFNELGKKCDLEVVFEAEKAPKINNDWYKDNKIKNFKSIFLKKGIIEEQKINFKILKYVTKKCDVLVFTNYSYYTEMLALIYAKILRKKYVLMIDGGIISTNEMFLKRALKKFLIFNALSYFSPSKSTDDFFFRILWSRKR